MTKQTKRWPQKRFERYYMIRKSYKLKIDNNRKITRTEAETVSSHLKTKDIITRPQREPREQEITSTSESALRTVKIRAKMI